MTHYDTLGVQPDATEAQIKAAYRKAAKTAHPDQGGSRDDMEALQRAYETLKDPDRRAHYDRTGDDAEPANEERQREAEARRLVSDLIALILNAQLNLATTDLKKVIGAEIGNKRATLVVEKSTGRMGINRANELAERLIQREKSEDDPVASAIRHHIANLERAVASIERAEAIFGRVSEIFDGYDYAFTEAAPPPTPGAKTVNWNDFKNSSAYADLFNRFQP